MLKNLKAIEVVWTGGLFYASALKTMKREFGNTLLVAHLRLKSMFIKTTNKTKRKISFTEIPPTD